MSARRSALDPGPVDRAITAVLARRPAGVLARRIRRILALLLVTLAGVLSLPDHPAPAPGAPVVRVRADLPVGAVLAPEHLSPGRGDAPDGALVSADQAVGRVLASPVRRGEVLTDARLVPPDGPDPGPGRVAVPVTVTDRTLVDLLRPGMRVAVLGLPTEGEPAVLTEDAVVVTVPSTSDDRAAPVVLGIPAARADSVAAATLLGRVTFRFS